MRLLSKIIISLVLSFTLFSSPVSAAKTFQANSAALNTVVTKSGIEQTDVNSMFSKIVSVAMGLTGIIYLGLMVYAGFRWMTASGNEQAIKDARNTIIAATVGLILILSAYAITNFVSTQLISKA